MSSVISLKEAARRTGLTTRQIGDRIANRELTIERDPVTGEKGIYPHTLRGVNGYQPPEPTRPAKPPPPSPPKPEPWTPSPGDMAALIKLDDRGRAVAIADLVRRHPHLTAWFRDNPLPPVFRKPQPPPPPQARPEPPHPPPPPEPPPTWQMSWQFDLHSWETPPRPPAPPPKPEPPKPPPPPVPVTSPTSSESLGRLFMDVLRLALAGLARNARISLDYAFQSATRLVVVVLSAVVLVGAYLVAQALLARNNLPARSTYQPTPPHVLQSARHRRPPPVSHHVLHPAAPSPPRPYPLPPLRSPGAGRPNLTSPG